MSHSPVRNSSLIIWHICKNMYIYILYAYIYTLYWLYCLDYLDEEYHSPKIAKCLWDAQAFHFSVFYHHYPRRNTTISRHWIVSQWPTWCLQHGDLPKLLAYLYVARKLAEATSSDSEAHFWVVGRMDLYMPINSTNPQIHQLRMHHPLPLARGGGPKCNLHFWHLRASEM